MQSDVTIDSHIKDFETLNALSHKGGIVFFGGSYFSRMNIPELCSDNGMTETVCDRSVEGLKIKDAPFLLKSAVYDLRPEKVFINIGDSDVAAENASVEKFIDKYEWLLLCIHKSCPGVKIYVVGIAGADAAHSDKVNKLLSTLAKDTGCDFIDIAKEAKKPFGFERVFDMLKPYMRSFPITPARAILSPRGGDISL